MEIEAESLAKPLHQDIASPCSAYRDQGCLSRLFFTWVLPTYRKSLSVPLQPEDCTEVGEGETVAANVMVYRGSVIRSLFCKYKGTITAGILLGVVAPAFEYCLPLYMLYIEDYMSSDQSTWIGLGSVGVLAVALVLRSVLWRAMLWLEKQLFVRVQSCLVTFAYSSLLTASTNIATSEIVNEVQVDIDRIAETAHYFFWTIAAMIEVAIALAILVPSVGAAGCLGLGSMGIVMVVNFYGASKSNDAWDLMMERRDERMKYATELFSNIKMLKLSVWEGALLTRVKDVRLLEEKSLKKLMLIWCFMSFSLSASPIIATAITISVNQLLLHNEMTVTVAFTTMSIFYVLQGPLLWMPGCLTWLWSAVTSARRIDKVVRGDKVQDSRERATGQRGKVTFQNAFFAYNTESEPILKGINLTISPGEFVAIVGKVGSGKSSIVNALLGEMKSRGGSLSVNGSIAYTAALESWIQNATLRDNVLFGKPYDPEKYQNAVRVASLSSDIDLLAGGDLTEIGEKGINLSGGQKARVSLARAVYQNCDIYILDDPLSSVDAHVGAHIFHQCFLSALKGKTRILVTHNTNFLSLVDRVIVMESGNIAETASYSGIHSDLQAISAPEAPNSAPRSEKEATGLVSDEDRQVGKVDLSIYMTFLRYCGGVKLLFLCLFLLILWLGTRFLGDLSLKSWTEHPENSENDYFVWYLACGSLASLSLLLRALFLISGGVKAGTRVHSAMVERLINAPINLFYDVTPLGRILNRLSKDQIEIETEIAWNLNEVFTSVASSLGTIAAAVYFLPWTVLLVPLMAVALLYLQRIYLQLARETTRLSHLCKSPILQKFTESVAGLKVIRSFEKQSEFTEVLHTAVGRMNRVMFTNGGIEGWLMVWIEILSTGFVLLCVMYLVIAKEAISPAVAALVLTYMVPLLDSLRDSVQDTASLERLMISMERAHALTQ